MKKETNEKKETKRSYLFELIILCSLCLLVFCLCGCASCGFTNTTQNGYTVSGCTVPGCGGCLSSGSGCNSCLYSENISCFSLESENGDGLSISACDNLFFGNCLGCGSNPHRRSCGYLETGSTTSDVSGCFYYKDADDRICGKNDANMKVCGSGGCVNVDPDEADMGFILDIIRTEFGLK